MKNLFLVGNLITIFGLLSSGRAGVSQKSGFMIRKIDNIFVINVAYTEYIMKNNIVGLSV